MNGSQSVSVWYTEQERRRLEEAAALAGYKHLSKYIRDKSLNRRDPSELGRDSLDAWAERQELAGRLADIERSHRSASALLAMLLFLVRKKATSAEMHQLFLACEKSTEPGEVLAAALPELSTLLTRFLQDS